MIPILYDSNETTFISNGLGRLRDCISCVVTEERNGVYECDFEYPVDGVNFNRIQLGKIIAVEHDETNDIQPFDIVSYSRQIDGIVSFHAVHVSYRQCALTVTGTNKQSLSDAFTWLGTASPNNPFSYWTDKDNVGFLSSADGVPHSVRNVLGGMEGSILDTYGGEYEWDKWTVKLWKSRGTMNNFTIRYGVNLMAYDEDADYSDTYTAVIPYWIGQDNSGNEVVVKGNMVSSGQPPYNGQERCIPLDLTDKFETQPTAAQVEAAGLSYMRTNQTHLPAQNIAVDFVRLEDSPEYAHFASLQQFGLCDRINIEFPRYNMSGTFKIVKTEYDVLSERYNTLELGALSTSLSEALGINAEQSTKLLQAGGGGGVTPDDYIVDHGTVTAGSITWVFRKYHSGVLEMWGRATTTLAIATKSGNIYTTANDYEIAMPAMVNSVSFITAELSGGGWADITSLANPPRLRLYAPTSYSSADRTLSYHFLGTYS